MAIKKEYVYFDKMSYDDYTSLCDKDEINKYEYVNGNVYMLARGSDDHMDLGANLTTLINVIIGDNGCRVSQEKSIYLSDNENNIEIEYIPDITVKCPDDSGDFTTVLVIEILSSGSHKRDLVDKAKVYKDMMVLEYVIINLEEKIIFQYNQPNWEIKIYGCDDTFQSGLYPEFRFDVDKFLSFDKRYIMSIITDIIVNNYVSR